MNDEANVKVFITDKSLIDNYGAAEVAAHVSKNNKTLLFAKHYVRSSNLYGTNDWEHIKEISELKYNSVSNVNKPNTKRWVLNNKHLWKLWEVANEEYLNNILDVNRYNTFNIFPPKQSPYQTSIIQYNDNTIDLKTWYKITIDAIQHFNKTFFTVSSPLISSTTLSQTNSIFSFLNARS